MMLKTPARKIIISVFLIILIATGIGRIAGTYHVFSQTTDEPAHIAAGMEWLDHKTYIYEPHHPPLARVATALGPYIAGIRLSESQRKYLDNLKLPQGQNNYYQNWGWYYHNLYQEMWKSGEEILGTGKDYFRNLTLARIGILPFFIATSLLVWAWARRLFGDIPAIVSLLLFTTLPTILAHSGIATTDIPLTATLLGAIYVFTLWLEEATVFRSILLGLVVAMTVITKFSSILFFPVCVAAILLWRYIPKSHRNEAPNIIAYLHPKNTGLILLAGFIIIWSGYQFSVGSLLSKETRPHQRIDRIVGTEGPAHDVTYKLLESPIIPAIELFRGIEQVATHAERGHQSYLLGEVRTTGWWYFFPVVLAVKTPLPFLIFSLFSIILLIYETRNNNNWQPLVPAISAISILLVCLPSSINIGVRHVLPVYPLLAVATGYGAVRLWNIARTKYIGPVMVTGLLIWQLVSSFNAHPDYLAYFNELADDHPEKILNDSDLDWGQDLKRLADVLHARGISDISIAGWTPVQLSRFNINSRKLEPGQPVTGWVAIRLFMLKVRDGYSWLEDYKPVMKVGESIYLYRIPESDKSP